MEHMPAQIPAAVVGEDGTKYEWVRMADGNYYIMRLRPHVPRIWKHPNVPNPDDTHRHGRVCQNRPPQHTGTPGLAYDQHRKSSAPSSSFVGERNRIDAGASYGHEGRLALLTAAQNGSAPGGVAADPINARWTGSFAPCPGFVGEGNGMLAGASYGHGVHQAAFAAPQNNTAPGHAAIGLGNGNQVNRSVPGSSFAWQENKMDLTHAPEQRFDHLPGQVLQYDHFLARWVISELGSATRRAPVQAVPDLCRAAPNYTQLVGPFQQVHTSTVDENLPIAAPAPRPMFSSPSWLSEREGHEPTQTTEAEGPLSAWDTLSDRDRQNLLELSGLPEEIMREFMAP
ncbi:hypothetical protein K469DRAFT_755855 [Zopfia rhizophila CBS 207.26]|uniref:Uncharacterized protein n=1 Tax=Zopfia rhizophila CBS 207.26 TaxID=1314779 RepID=A0A6A6D9R1_9PEZI|nr:hypothetical protein K469DRAFT_755855 [Zopfia rhizophila CBS 207.26]